MKQMIFTEKQIECLTRKTKEQLLNILYKVEDETMYKSHKISRTIDFLQEDISNHLCYDIYFSVYLKNFEKEHDIDQKPVSFAEFYDNEWQDEEIREWYETQYKEQNKGE